MGQLEKMGELQVVCGPMFSGKSEELIRRLRRSNIAKKRVLLISPTIDSRNAEIVTTHAGNEFPCVKTDRIIKALYGDFAMPPDVIGIDEVQFFSGSAIEDILYLANFSTVIVSGLDTNFRFEPFGIMPQLMAYAEKVDKLTAICNKCGSEATKTQRLINGEPAPLDGPEVLIGATESYEARCRACWETA